MNAGDTLSPEALYEFARAIVDRDPPPDVLYCDEDRLASDGRTRFGPVFKPSWSPEMLLSYHYTGRLTLARRALVNEVGGFDLSLDEAAEWDMMLRLSEQTDQIVRIPRCLYHNASNPSSSITDGRPRIPSRSGISPGKKGPRRGTGCPAAQRHLPGDLATSQSSPGQRDHPDP